VDRREFLTKAAMLAALVGVPVTVTSCSSSGPATPGSGTGNVSGTATGSGHTHNLPLADQEVMQIAQGARVQKDFDDGQHPHTFTFN
jgi:hypothetical protein